jgi:hypothetical protein
MPAGAGSVGHVGIGTQSPSNRLTVSGNADITGNLGIGTTNPGYKLDICREGSGIAGRFGKETIFGEWYVDGQRVGLQGTRSSDSAVSGFYIENPTNTGTSNFELLSFKTIGSEKMRITNCGYVGMLQTSPDTTLDIGNTTNQAVWSSCSSCNANLGENFENNIIIQAQHAPGANCAYGYPASNLVFRASNASNDIWNLGAIQAVVDPFGGSYYQGGLVFLTKPSSNDCNPIGRKTQGGPLVPILALGQKASNCRIAYFNSRVGIGTADPSYPLHIDNNCTDAGTLSSGGNLNGTAYFGYGGLVVGTQSTTGHTALFTNSSGRDILFGGWNGSANDERMRITSGGRVGIGVTSPNYTLHTGGRGYFFATNQDAGWGMLTLDYGNGVNGSIYAIQMAEGGATNAAVGYGSYASSNCGDIVMWTNDGGGLVERSRMYSNGAAKIATMGANSTTVIQKSFSVAAGACVNVCFDISTDIPSRGTGYVFQADIHVGGYGSAGASGLLYKASVAGYDGHYVGIGAYHKDAELVKCASGVDIKIYNPSSNSNLLGVTVYNCSGTYTHVGTLRMVLTY